MCVGNSQAVIEHCVFSANETGSDGGGLYCFYLANIVVRNCTFDANYAPGAGAGICTQQDAAVELVNCTLYNNQASFAGGILIWNSAFLIENTIIAFNGEGGALRVYEEATEVTLRCCDIYGNIGGDWDGDIAEQLGIEGNISLDPLFCHDENPEQRLSLNSESPCAWANNPECGNLGAWPVGCGDTSTIDHRPTTCPEPLRFAGNIPSPFTQSSLIAYVIEAPLTSMPVELGVYDLAGRRVRTLAQGVQDPGRHLVSWDGADHSGRRVPGGIYLLRLAGSDLQVTRRLIFVR